MVLFAAYITCDGCNHQFTTDESFSSADEAREAIIECKWLVQRVCNRILEFCPECQAAGARGEIAKAAAK